MNFAGKRSESNSSAAETEIEVLCQKPEKLEKNTDGGWGWIIVCGSFIITVIVGGSYVAFSLLYVEFVDMFDTSRAIAGWIGSLYVSTGYFLGTIFCVAIDRFGSRVVGVSGSLIACTGFLLSSVATSVTQLYLTFGIIAGIGAGMLLMSSYVLIQLYFSRRRAIAAGIATTGFSVGGLTAGPVSRMLIDVYGVRGTLVIMAAIFIQLTVVCCLFRPVDAQRRRVLRTRSDVMETVLHSNKDVIVVVDRTSDTAHDREAGFCHSAVQPSNKNCCNEMLGFRCCCPKGLNLVDFSLLRRVPFVLYLVATVLTHVGCMALLQHTPSRAAHYGVSPDLTALLPTMIESATGLSRFLMGFVANSPCANLPLQFGVTVTLSGIMQMTMWLAKTFELMALYCVIQGLLNGGFFCILTTLLVELNGVEFIVQSTSLWSLAVALGYLIGTPFVGLLFDASDGYNLPFVVNGAVQCVGGLFGLAIYFMKCRRKVSRAQHDPK